jgi:rubrerythrin
MSKTRSSSDVCPGRTTRPSLTEILDAHARMETQVGEIYVCFAGTFSQDPELRRMWTAMALEEGGHAALMRAVSKGLLSGALKAKSILLPLEYLDSLPATLTEYRRQAEQGVSLDHALRMAWELECSELESMRELLVSSINLAELGFPTSVDNEDVHLGRLRDVIQRYTTDEALRREVKFISLELLRPFPGGDDD